MENQERRSGPLAGLKLIEMGTVGPVPFCGMLLCDLGAEVIRIDRAGGANVGMPADPRMDIMSRGKDSISFDLKDPDSVDKLCRLIGKADILIEGYRPGVMERLGLGPESCQELNPRLVYGRMTGWGQQGPLANVAGHDINYLALTGALSLIGEKDRGPVPPLNMLADYGGGALYLALGIVAAIYERHASGKGQVVDAAMIDGVSSLMTSVRAGLARNTYREGRGSNVLDGGAPFYGVYRTADDGYIAVGCIEQRFFINLLGVLGLDPELAQKQYDQNAWPTLRKRLADRFTQESRQEWVQRAHGIDACLTPVLSPREALHDEHMVLRGVNRKAFGIDQPAPAPRLSRSQSGIFGRPGGIETDFHAVLKKWDALS